MNETVIEELEELKRKIEGTDDMPYYYNIDRGTEEAIRFKKLSDTVRRYISTLISDKDIRTELLNRFDEVRYSPYVFMQDPSLASCVTAFRKGKYEMGTLIDDVIFHLEHLEQPKESIHEASSNNNSISGQGHNGNVQVNGDGNTIILNTNTESYTKNLKEDVEKIPGIDPETKKKLNEILDEIDADKKANKPIQDKIQKFILTAVPFGASAMTIISKLVEMSK